MRLAILIALLAGCGAAEKKKSAAPTPMAAANTATAAATAMATNTATATESATATATSSITATATATATGTATSAAVDPNEWVDAKTGKTWLVVDHYVRFNIAAQSCAPGYSMQDTPTTKAAWADGLGIFVKQNLNLGELIWSLDPGAPHAGMNDFDTPDASGTGAVAACMKN